MLTGTEFLTSNLNIAFPFRDTAEGLAQDVPAVHGATATLPINAFVDATIMLPATVSRLYLDEIVAMGVDIYQFNFKDQNGVLRLTGTTSISGWIPTHNYAAFMLSTPTQRAYGKFVIRCSVFHDFLIGTVGSDLFQQRLPLESCVVAPLVPSVETFEIYTALPPIPAPDVPGPIDGKVQLISGYNVETLLGSDVDSDTADISLEAAAGAGAGVAPCQHTTSVFTEGLMTVLPDSRGNILIVGGDDQCYSVLPLKAVDTFGIQGSCTACCSCDDYQNVFKALQRLLLRTQGALDVLKDAHNNEYTPGVQRYNSIIAPLYTQPYLQANGATGADWGVIPSLAYMTRSGSLHHATVNITLKNNGKWPIVPTALTIAWGSGTPPNPVVRQILWEYDGTGGPITAFGALTSMPTVKRGKAFSMHLLLYTDYTTVAPTWDGLVTVTYDTIVALPPYVSTMLTTPVHFT